MATSTIPADFVRTTSERSAVTISAGQQQYFNLGTKQGYVPIGVAFETSSTYAGNSMYLDIGQPFITANTWSTRMYNRASESVTIAGTLHILWMKV